MHKVEEQGGNDEKPSDYESIGVEPTARPKPRGTATTVKCSWVRASAHAVRRSQAAGVTSTSVAGSTSSRVRISGRCEASSEANCIAVFACSTADPTDCAEAMAA